MLASLPPPLSLFSDECLLITYSEDYPLIYIFLLGNISQAFQELLLIVQAARILQVGNEHLPRGECHRSQRIGSPPEV